MTIGVRIDKFSVNNNIISVEFTSIRNGKSAGGKSMEISLEELDLSEPPLEIYELFIILLTSVRKRGLTPTQATDLRVLVDWNSATPVEIKK